MASQQTYPSLIDIKRVIPSHCFLPSTITSMRYLAQDVMMIAVLFLLIKISFGTWYGCVLLPFYWMAQGTMMWALFVLGHDCGHDAFSTHKWLNFLVGTLAHAFLLVPHASWKISHKLHHKNTGNYEQDEIFYPVKDAEELPWLNRKLYFGLGLGWFGYLLFGYAPRSVSQLDLFHPKFHEALLRMIASLVACTAMAALLVWYSYCTSFQEMLLEYGVPLFVFATWIVVTTFLHHNDVDVPWYSSASWDYVKGNLSTVDRNYGIFHHITHNIGTHQIHHLFPSIPHYHLLEATQHFQQHFPQLERESQEPVIKSFIHMFKAYSSQRIMPAASDVFSYHSATNN